MDKQEYCKNMPMYLHFIKSCSPVFIALVAIFILIYIRMLFYKLFLPAIKSSTGIRTGHTCFYKLDIWSHLCHFL